MNGAVPSQRMTSDWINAFLEHTSSKNAPEIFRLWAGIATIAGTLERRVWTVLGGQVVYPAMYVMLVSTPGVGKTQAIRSTYDMWHSVSDLKVAPDSMTRASFVDELVKAQKALPIGGGALAEYAALNISVDELGTLISGYELDFLSVLNKIYDQPTIHHETRRGSGDGKHDKAAINPLVTMISGTQPAYLATLLPDTAWGMGFMARQVLIYSAEIQKVELFPEETLAEDPLGKALRHDLSTMNKMYGPIMWEQEAKDEIRRWYLSGMEPVPQHTNLSHYSVRRILHVTKLAVVAALSAGHSHVSLADFVRARDWMLAAELTMPDIFRAMTGRSDAALLQELHLFAFQIYAKQGRKPIHVSLLLDFLASRAPSDKVEKLLDIADKAKYVTRVVGSPDLWIPHGKTFSQ